MSSRRLRVGVNLLRWQLLLRDWPFLRLDCLPTLTVHRVERESECTESSERSSLARKQLTRASASPRRQLYTRQEHTPSRLESANHVGEPTGAHRPARSRPSWFFPLALLPRCDVATDSDIRSA